MTRLKCYQVVNHHDRHHHSTLYVTTYSLIHYDHYPSFSRMNLGRCQSIVWRDNDDYVGWSEEAACDRWIEEDARCILAIIIIIVIALLSSIDHYELLDMSNQCLSSTAHSTHLTHCPFLVRLMFFKWAWEKLAVITRSHIDRKSKTYTQTNTQRDNSFMNSFYVVTSSSSSFHYCCGRCGERNKVKLGSYTDDESTSCIYVHM